MATCFDDLNGKKLVIGLVHLLPMLGTPLYEDGNMDKMTEKAIADCKTLKENGADGGLIQTVDVFYPSTVHGVGIACQRRAAGEVCTGRLTNSQRGRNAVPHNLGADDEIRPQFRPNPGCYRRRGRQHG